MSFLSRFSNIMAGGPVAAAPKVKTPKTHPVASHVDEAKTRELIIEAKDQAFQIKRRAEEEAQRILGPFGWDVEAG